MGKRNLSNIKEQELQDFPGYCQYKNGQTLVFIHITKTAGTSQRKLLGLPPESAWKGRFNKHYSYQELRQILPNKVLNSALVATFVRNPWDRLVSIYHYRKLQYLQGALKKEIPVHSFQSFKTWMQFQKTEGNFSKRNMRPQVQWIKNASGEERVDFIGKFETLEEDSKRLCRILGLPYRPLDHLNRSRPNKEYKSYYTPALREMVSEVYIEDIDRFQYCF